MEALADDMNTPLAIAHLHKWADVLLLKPREEKIARFVSSMRILGLFRDTQHWKTREVDVALVEQIVAERHEARMRKDWKQSDVLREQLIKLGVTVADGAQGSVWRWN
jgi:cysteinyl-tRNA synthetase